ncbi:Appr-1-p processing protein [Labrys sp. KNU-23]|uniref:macro domain-containing protein n=1 Tax=Labrys sp. KNU-23 TaxID=2789216 RepID=UPI0011EEAA31|nr:macro domain-containing protein [Labrys sp. KNU-23]QEN91050.1 Appr-1-p processing protein [Labrys sp. KNU-23]
MRIVLVAKENSLAKAWSAAFEGVDTAEVCQGSIFDVACDAIVSPANSFGFMDGGIDLLYSHHFGWQVQDHLRTAIFQRHHGELLVGQAEIVETGVPSPAFLIAAPTMRVPMALGRDSINPYLATRAVLLLARYGHFPSGALMGAPLSAHLKTIAFPGMGTGVGRIPAEICAHQMRAAYDDVIGGECGMPQSWAEASERHQLLYTDRPVCLQ